MSAKELMRFADCFEDISRGVAKIKQKDCLPQGDHPVVDQGQDPIAGYSDGEDGVCTNVPAIVFGDHTRCVKYVTEPFFAGADGVKILKPKDSHNVRFWFHYLRSQHIENLGYSRHYKLLKQCKFKAFSLVEQELITLRLDHILRLIDFEESSLGKLEELVKSRFIEMFGDVFGRPEGIGEAEVQDIAEVGSSKRVFKDELLEDGVPFYRGTEISALSCDGRVTPSLFISKEHYKRLIVASGKPEIGDLLLPSICPDGQIWCVNTNEPFYFKDGRVLWVRPDRKIVNSVFLRYALGIQFVDNFEQVASGTTFAEMKIFLLKAMKVPIAPMELQEQFAAFVQQVDKLEFETQQAIDKLRTLYDSLAQEYFGD